MGRPERGREKEGAGGRVRQWGVGGWTEAERRKERERVREGQMDDRLHFTASQISEGFQA